VQIDDADLRAQVRAQARVRAAQERLERTRQQVPILQAQLQANLTTQQVSRESGQSIEAENALAAARLS